jgi:hypothetical protein
VLSESQTSATDLDADWWRLLAERKHADIRASGVDEHGVIVQHHGVVAPRLFNVVIQSPGGASLRS